MVDPLRKRDFHKPGPKEAHFLHLIKEIRHDLNESLTTLFFSKDLEKRKQALKNIKNLKKKFASKIEVLSMEKRKEILQALMIDLKKLENALKRISISIFMDIDGIKMPILSKSTHKPFTLFDFLDDVQLLSDREITFHFHAERVDGQLGVFFPGLNDPHFFEIMDTKGRLRLHFEYNFGGVEYTFAPSNPGSYTIRGKAKLRHLPSHVQFEIPHGVMPGDLNQAIDNLIREG